MSFIVANFLAEQARTTHRSSSSSSSSRLPEITQSATNSSNNATGDANNNTGAPSTAPRAGTNTGGETDVSPGRRTGGVSSSSRSGSAPNVAATLDGPALVLSCIRRAEALLPTGGSASEEKHEGERGEVRVNGRATEGMGGGEGGGGGVII